MLFLIAVLAAFSVDNAEFLKTVEAQRAEGYTWHEIECRQVTEGLPALTIDTPTGKQLVCHKLQK